MHKHLLISVIIILLAALLLSACGGQGTTAVTQAPVEAPVENTPQAQAESSGYPAPVNQQPTGEASFGGPYPLPVGGDSPATGSTLDGLLATLQAAGLDTQLVGDVSQPFFSAAGKRLQLNGEEIQVYEYSAPEAAEAEAATVAADGSSVGTTMVDWISTPHFYRSGNLIVIYVGENAVVLQALQSLLGAQFAGG